MKLFRHSLTLCGKVGGQRRFQPLLRQIVQGTVFNSLLDQRIDFRFQRRLILFRPITHGESFSIKLGTGALAGFAGNRRHHQVTGRHVLHLA